MSTLIIRSNADTVADVLIPDLGILIPFGGGTETFTDDENIAASGQSGDLDALTKDSSYVGGTDPSARFVRCPRDHGAKVTPRPLERLNCAPPPAGSRCQNWK